MKNEPKKTALIVNEILALLLHHGANDIHIQIKEKDNITCIEFNQYACNFDKEFVERLKFDLTAQRQNEVEGYYWRLVGKDDVGEELHLVGAMIDESDVVLEGNRLTIYIKRMKSV